MATNSGTRLKQTNISAIGIQATSLSSQCVCHERWVFQLFSCLLQQRVQLTIYLFNNQSITKTDKSCFVTNRQTLLNWLRDPINLLCRKCTASWRWCSRALCDVSVEPLEPGEGRKWLKGVGGAMRPHPGATLSYLRFVLWVTMAQISKTALYNENLCTSKH